MSVKSVLTFVGKSAAFAIISGVVWGFLVFFVSFSGRYNDSSPSVDQDARVTAQMDAYDKQTRQVQEQLERSSLQQQRTENLLDTQERLYAEQEKLQQRFASVLDKWEKVQSK